MDRVLLIIDDIQYSRHIEMTLRKVGFDIESINNEFNMNDSILSFNPDFIICRGSSSRLSTLSVGRKLKDSNTKFNGKTILVFPEGIKVSADDLMQLKLDLLLFDPVSTLKIAIHLFSFSEHNYEFIKDKLLKFAITDSQFRSYEQQILKNAGLTLDSEIQVISGMEYKPILRVMDGPSSTAALAGVPSHEEITLEKINKINQELKAAEQELPLRIDTYNHMVKNLEQDPNFGLKKWQTKKAVNQLRKDLIKEQKTDIKDEQDLNIEKIKFAQALFEKSNVKK